MVSASLTVSGGADGEAREVGGEVAISLAATFTRTLPDVHSALIEDASAIRRADPAARSLDEVIRASPGFYAIAAYRVAHVLHSRGALLLARMLSSAAHGGT